MDFYFRIVDDSVESEPSPKSPNAPQTIENLSDHILAMQTYAGQDSDAASQLSSSSQRKVWTREEFLHGTAGMGGPNIAMRVRYVHLIN